MNPQNDNPAPQPQQQPQQPSAQQYGGTPQSPTPPQPFMPEQPPRQPDMQQQPAPNSVPSPFQPNGYQGPQQYQQNAAPAPQHSSAWGIISIILPLLSLALPGLIIGLIGRSKAKKIGHNDTLSLVGVILSAFVLLLQAIVVPTLVLTSFKGAQTKARDTVGANNLNMTYQQLEVFYNDNAYYPESLDELSGSRLDPAVLSEVQSNERYTYRPSACLQGECLKYELTYEAESTATPVYRRSLN